MKQKVEENTTPVRAFSKKSQSGKVKEKLVDSKVVNNEREFD